MEFPEPAWVKAQTLERHRRELEAEEAEYEERLAAARRKEAAMKKKAKAKVNKKPVCLIMFMDFKSSSTKIYFPYRNYLTMYQKLKTQEMTPSYQRTLVLTRRALATIFHQPCVL